MSRKCELSGVGVMHGNLVSHSQRKTRRKYKPNLHRMKFFSNLLNNKFAFRVSAGCIRSIDKLGGFDQYMIKVSSSVLSDSAKSVKRDILQKSLEVAV